MNAKDLSAEFRAHKPAYLKVQVDGEENPKVIGVAENGKRRFFNAAKLISQLEWTKMEGFDSEDKLVLALGDEIDEPEPVEEVEMVPVENRDAQLLRILTASQDMVLTRFQDMFIGLLQGYQDHMSLMLERVAQLEEHYGSALSALKEAAEAGQTGPMELAGSVIQGAMMKSMGGGNNAPSPQGFMEFVKQLPPEQLKAIVGGLVPKPATEPKKE